MKTIITAMLLCSALAVSGPAFSQEDYQEEASGEESADIVAIRQLQAVLGEAIQLVEQHDRNAARLQVLAGEMSSTYEAARNLDLGAVRELVGYCDGEVLALVTEQQTLLLSVRKLLKKATAMEKKLDRWDTPAIRDIKTRLENGEGLRNMTQGIANLSAKLNGSKKQIQQGCRKMKTGLSGLDAMAGQNAENVFIPADRFDRVREGQTDATVFEIMGSSGELLFSTGTIALHSWRDAKGYFLQVTFVDGEVLSKMKFKF